MGNIVFQRPAKDRASMAGLFLIYMLVLPDGKSAERWLHNFGRRGKWNFCLTTGTLMPANQERR